MPAPGFAASDRSKFVPLTLAPSSRRGRFQTQLLPSSVYEKPRLLRGTDRLRVSRLPGGVDSHRAAALELEWWIVHRENPPGLPDALANLQAEIYGIPAERFAEHARLRAQAMNLRDGKGSAITEADWQRIGKMLAASWDSLYRAVQAAH